MKFLFILLAIIFINIYFSSASEANEKCLRCHSSPTLYLKEQGQKLKLLYVNEDSFNNSNHKNLKCIDCHSSKEFSEWPHKASSENKKLSCVTCHDPANNDNAIVAMSHIDASLKNLTSINKALSSSAHKRINLDCSSCHDPHIFDRQTSANSERILGSNKICLNCHSEKSNPGLKTNPPKVDAAHEWLPNPELHWKNVRCVDCHSEGADKKGVHQIKPAKEAVKACESCHSQNSILLEKLYKYEDKKVKEEYGFRNEQLLKNSYIIGSTRNKLMDTLSLVIFGSIIASISGHSALRYISRRKLNRKENSND